MNIRKKLEDPNFYKENRIDAHSDHIFYVSEEAFIHRDMSSSEQLLDGKWHFRYYEDLPREDFNTVSMEEAKS